MAAIIVNYAISGEIHLRRALGPDRVDGIASEDGANGLAVGLGQADADGGKWRRRQLAAPGVKIVSW
jgi:hypothetical protein